MRSKPLTVVLLAVLGLVGPALPAETARPDSVVLTLDEVVVTAERVRHRVRDCAASVSVVTAQDIERLGSRSATDALAALPGIFIQRTGQFGRTDIDVRGIGGQGTRVVVLVDGRPEKMALFGCTVTHTLPVNNVERIELVRGPLSVLYGSDALGGVVNIITRKAEAPFELSSRLELGSFRTIHGRLSFGTRQERFQTLMALDKAISQGHLPNSQFNGNDLALRAGYNLSSALKLDFTGKFFTGVKHEPKGVNDPETLVAKGWNRYDRGGLDLTANLDAPFINGFLKLYRTFGEHRFSDGWHSLDNTSGFILHLSRQLALNLIQAGLEVKRLAGTRIQSDTSRPSWARNQFDAYCQDEQRLGPVIANAGLRIAHDEISGNAFAPKAGMVAQLPARLNLRASINRGFRFPPLNYTSVFPPKNPELRPERTWNYEAGAGWEPLAGVAIDLAGFIITGEDLIETARNPSPPPPVKFQNKGSFRFKGVELGVTAQQRWLQGRLSTTIADYGVHTRGRPGLKLDAELGAEVGRIGCGMAGHYVGRYYGADSSLLPIPSYATFDSRFSYRLNAWLELFCRVENLLNRQYDAFAELPGTAAGLYRMPGRSFTVGLDLGVKE
ncbi:MAG: TonB-dependent receptor [candidate division WOR-3 bacterium]